jgi:hypothetical protein
MIGGVCAPLGMRQNGLQGGNIFRYIRQRIGRDGILIDADQ